MRLPAFVVVFLGAACGGGDSASDAPAGSPPDASSCPEQIVPGESCVTPVDLWCYTSGDVCGLAWGADGFAACRCLGSVFVCDDLYPTDGADCPYPDEVSCSREGPPACDPVGQPSGAFCSCSSGTWTCDDTQWCDCPATHRPSIEGASCNFTQPCSYPSLICTCSAGQITCTSA